MSPRVSGGGNPELEPEEADTWTVGLVWTPTFMNPRYSQLQASIDWYRIEIDHAVAQIDAGEILGLCFDPRVNPDFSPAGVLAGGMAIIAQPQLRLAQCLRDRTQPLHRLDAGHVRA